MPPPRATAACCCDAPTSVLALLQIGLGTHSESSGDVGAASAPATGWLTDQMSSPGECLPVRVGLAFGIAPCGELCAKEFGGGADMCAQNLPRKWPSTPLYCSKKSLRGLEEKAVFIAKGRGEKIRASKNGTPHATVIRVRFLDFTVRGTCTLSGLTACDSQARSRPAC